LTALARIIATWFYCGLAPFAPGTAGSVAAIAIAWALNRYLGMPPLAIAGLGVLLAVPGIWAAGVTAKASGKKDPQIVVVDEVVGQWITLAGATSFSSAALYWTSTLVLNATSAASLNWKFWLLALVLFRVFDVWKPPPVRQLERLPGGLGIVADDAMAGVYAALVLFGAGRLHLY
jgi:phosphatidylglycerophosphatase A